MKASLSLLQVSNILVSSVTTMSPGSVDADQGSWDIGMGQRRGVMWWYGSLVIFPQKGGDRRTDVMSYFISRTEQIPTNVMKT